jgi:hypothetical protein
MKGRGIATLLRATLVVLLGVGTYELWRLAAVRDHPWQLETRVDSLAAECMTGSAAKVFAAELHELNGQVLDAKKCLAEVEGAWPFRRNYDPCIDKLVRSSLTAMQILRSQEIHIQDEKARLAVALKSLELELYPEARAPGPAGRANVRNQNQFRARTLLETARNLAALGQTESALTAALSAQAAWLENENYVAAELARFYDARLRAKWQLDAQELLAWTRQSGRKAILVDKLGHRCLLLDGGRVEKTFVANLSRNWHRIKIQELDASTPEGRYKVKQKLPSSSFGAALLLDYPNSADWQRFNAMKRNGEIASRARIGGAIEIHGSGRPNSDWTDGCVALENVDMEELFRHAYVGMPVTIVGTCSVGEVR